MPSSAETSCAVSPPPGRNATAAATATTIRTLRSVLFISTAQDTRRGPARPAPPEPLRGGQRPQLGREAPIGLVERQRRGRRTVGRLRDGGRRLARRALGALGRLGREAVADAEVRVDVAPLRRRLLQL